MKVSNYAPPTRRFRGKLVVCSKAEDVASRVEGGPASIMEAGLTKTPFISTDVGLASEILDKNSIFTFPDYLKARPNTEFTYNKVQNFSIPKGFEAYINMFREIAKFNES